MRLESDPGRMRLADLVESLTGSGYALYLGRAIREEPGQSVPVEEWETRELPQPGPSLVRRQLTGTSQSECPTKTGSLTKVTPNASCTPSRMSRARAATSLALASPRLVIASVCLVERAAGPGMP